MSHQLRPILVKVADISNEVRPLEVAEPWLDCLLQEFFMQVFSPGEVLLTNSVVEARFTQRRSCLTAKTAISRVWCAYVNNKKTERSM